MAKEFIYKGTFIPRSSFEDAGMAIVKLRNIYWLGCPREDHQQAMGEVFGFRPVGDHIMKPVLESNHGYMASTTYGHGRNLATAQFDVPGTNDSELLFMASRRYGMFTAGGAIAVARDIFESDNQWDFYMGSSAGGVTSVSLGGGDTEFFPDDVSAWKYANKHVKFAGSIRNGNLRIINAKTYHSYELNCVFNIYDAGVYPGNNNIGYKVKLVDDHCFFSGGNYEKNGANRVFYLLYDSTSDSWDTTNYGELVSSDGTNATTFGTDIEYDTVTDTLFVSAGDYGVYMFTKDGSNNYVERGKISPPADTTSGDSWGENIYAYDNFLFVAAPEHCFDTTGGNYILGAGAVYVYTYDSTSITFREKLIDLKERTTDGGERCFGRNDMLFDGKILMIGCTEGNGGFRNGNVHWWRYEDPSNLKKSYSSSVVSC